MYNIANFKTKSEIEKNKERVRREQNESLGYLGTSVAGLGGLGIHDRIKRGKMIEDTAKKARSQASNRLDEANIIVQKANLRKAADNFLYNDVNKGLTLGTSLGLANWFNDAIAENTADKKTENLAKRIGTGIGVAGVGSVLAPSMLRKGSLNPFKGFKNRNEGFRVSNNFNSNKRNAEDYFNSRSRNNKNNQQNNQDFRSKKEKDEELNFGKSEIPSIQKKFKSNDENDQMEALGDIQRRSIQRVKNKKSKNKKEDIKLNSLSENVRSRLTNKELSYNDNDYKELKNKVESGDFNNMYFLANFEQKNKKKEITDNNKQVRDSALVGATVGSVVGASRPLSNNKNSRTSKIIKSSIDGIGTGIKGGLIGTGIGYGAKKLNDFRN